MIEPYRGTNEDGEEFLYMRAETPLEEKFILWFATRHGLRRQRVDSRESLRLPGGNDPQLAVENVHEAYREFCDEFHYVELPPLYGVEFDKATQIIRSLGLAWEIEGSLEDLRFAPGTVVHQHPSPGPVSIPDGVVRLVLNKVDLDRFF